MFPIDENDAYRKGDGSLTTMGEAIGSGGGGEHYVLPTATDNRLGGVKIGSGINVDEDGTISVSGGSGGALSYKETTKSCNLTKNDWSTNYFNVSDLADKTIVGCAVKTSGSDSDYMSSLTSITPNSNGEIPIKIHSTASTSPVRLTIRIFYY